MTEPKPRHVYMFTPTYTGTPRIETLYCLLETLEGLKGKGIDSKMKFTVGDSLIPRARNMAVSDVLYNPEYTDLVMIDDDIRWEPGAILRLLSHDKDVVLGAYPKRVEPLEFPVKRIDGETPDASGLLKVRMGPAGFLRMTRTCLERMVRAYSDRVYYDPLVPGKKAWALFMLEMAPDPEAPNEFGINELWGEDFTFCRLWNAIGGEVWLDTLLHFEHIGRKAFAGCYAEHLETSPHYIGQKSAA